MTRRCRAETGSGRPRSSVAVRCACAVLGSFVTACFPPDAGQEPHLDEIYFPVGLALSPVPTAPSVADAGISTQKHKWLFVANSDFDLQYNGGSIQAYDLDKIAEVLPDFGSSDPCSKQCDANQPAHSCEKSAAGQFTAPGLCAPIAAKQFLGPTVKIGAFATDLLYLARPEDRKADKSKDMLVVPVRGDDTLHWIDVDPDPAKGTMDCGRGDDGSCDDQHRRGDNPSAENTRGGDATLPPEPFGVAADDRGEAIVTTHQSDGALGLFVNDWFQTDAKKAGPNLQFVLRGLPKAAIGIASIPEPAYSRALRGTSSATFYEPGFYVTFRNAAEIQLVGYFSDQGDFKSPDVPSTSPGRPFLEAIRTSTIFVNSQGYDSRGIAVDPSARQLCEAACDKQPGPRSCRATCVDARESIDASGNLVPPSKADCDPSADPPAPCANYVKCLRGCTTTPLGVYVSNRTPSTLILGQTTTNSSTTSSDDTPRLFHTEYVAPGPSRVVVGEVKDPSEPTGLGRRVFVICYDSRLIFVYDPKAGRMDTVIRTGRGPHALAIDETRGLGYIGHFTDSYLGVVDLDRANPDTYGKIILTIGQPTPPRAQK